MNVPLSDLLYQDWIDARRQREAWERRRAIEIDMKAEYLEMAVQRVGPQGALL